MGDFDWKEFVPRLKQKTYEEIKQYAKLFFLVICLFLARFVYFIVF